MLEIKKQLESRISEVLDIEKDKVRIEETQDLNNGDLTTNIAMQLSKELGRNPRDIAEEIVFNLGNIDGIEKVEVAGPGFINFYLSESYLRNVVSTILDKRDDAFKLDLKKGKNLIIEYTDPNPFKILHIGHLYTNMVGEAFARLAEALGGCVKRANYQGDVGLHVAKTMWGLKKIILDNKEITFEELRTKPLPERVSYLGNAYMLGYQYYDDIKDEEVISFVKNVNYYIFSLYISSLPRQEFFEEFEDMGIKEWYLEGRQWCLDYFETIYARTGTRFDYYFFESEMSEKGLNLVLNNTDGKGKGIFKDDEGSVIYKGDPAKGLHTRVFVNKEGVPTYEAKDLVLPIAKYEKFRYDESVIITADEQTGYFRVVLDALSQLEPQLANTTKHMPHGMVKLPGAEKMSSRKGKIIEGEWLLNETQLRVKDIMKESGKWSDEDIERISDTIAVAAIKYAFLKVTVGKDVIFDVEKSISFDGDTGPYLLYVYARCRSLLEGTQNSDPQQGEELYADEKELIRVLGRFEDALLASAVQYAPNILCSYLFDLGQTFNKFYQNVRILDSDRKEELLAVVGAAAQTMRYGLDRLGIKTVEHM